MSYSSMGFSSSIFSHHILLKFGIFLFLFICGNGVIKQFVFLALILIL